MRVHANAVCRTDLHVIEGELPPPRLPLVPGHQIAGNVAALGEGVTGLALGQRVGVPWLGGADGVCPYCVAGYENLCERPTFTGYHVDGGYAEYARARAALRPPPAGRVLRPRGGPAAVWGPDRLPGAAAGAGGGSLGPGPPGAVRVRRVRPHSIQVALHFGHEVFAMSRGERSREAALELGASWAGSGEDRPPVQLDSAIIFAPAGELVPRALAAVRRGGIVVCAGIHMSPIPEFAYELLWGERVLRSVANLTRLDGQSFLELAPEVPVRTEFEVFPLEEAVEALSRMKDGSIRGAAVLTP